MRYACWPGERSSSAAARPRSRRGSSARSWCSTPWDRAGLRGELDALGLRVTGGGPDGQSGPLRVPLDGRSAQGIIASIGAELTRFQIAEPTLEDAYLQLLERACP